MEVFDGTVVIQTERSVDIIFSISSFISVSFKFSKVR